jgi:hypothetical protein
VPRGVSQVQDDIFISGRLIITPTAYKGVIEYKRRAFCSPLSSYKWDPSQAQDDSVFYACQVCLYNKQRIVLIVI